MVIKSQKPKKAKKNTEPRKPHPFLKKERNDKLYADWRRGMTYFEMRLKYNIAENSIRAVLVRYWKKYGRVRDASGGAN